MSAAPFVSTNGGAMPLNVSILARDVDGLALLREGESITVTTSHSDTVVQTAQGVYDSASQRYEVEVAGLTIAGNYYISVQTPIGTSVKANFTLVCAPGYEPGAGGQCRERPSPCQSATATPSQLRFIARDTLLLADLGTASEVDLLPNVQTTRFNVTGGRASVHFDQPGSFLVRLTDATTLQQCTLSLPRTVSCALGEVEQEGQCVVPQPETDPWLKQP